MARFIRGVRNLHARNESAAGPVYHRSAIDYWADGLTRINAVRMPGYGIVTLNHVVRNQLNCGTDTTGCISVLTTTASTVETTTCDTNQVEPIWE